jgi:hypothetical protein
MNAVAQVFGTSGWEHKVTLYIPSTTDVDKHLSADTAKDVVTRAKRLLANIFGGATAISAEGSWLSGETLVDESVTLVYAFSNELTEDALSKIRLFCEELKSELRQDAIALEIDNRLILY